MKPPPTSAVSYNQILKQQNEKNAYFRGFECHIFITNTAFSYKTLHLIIQSTLQPLFECGPISRVLKTTTQGAFSEHDMAARCSFAK